MLQYRIQHIRSHPEFFRQGVNVKLFFQGVAFHQFVQHFVFD